MLEQQRDLDVQELQGNESVVVFSDTLGGNIAGPLTLPDTSKPIPRTTRALVDQSSFGHNSPDSRFTMFQSFLRC